MRVSYVFKKGKEAREYMEAQNNDFSKQLVKIKSGDSLFVKLAGVEDYVLYYAHSAFGSFRTTLCHDKAGKGADLYCKASELLYKDYFAERDRLKEAGKSDKEIKKATEELRQAAYTLKAKPRYLMAFFSVDTGEQILIDVTENQGDAIIKSIDKYGKKRDERAFELAKVGESTKTTFTLTPVLDMDDDLDDKQRKTFEKLVEEGAAVDDEAYGNVFQFRDKAGQVADLKLHGFDVERLGIEEVRKGDEADGEAEPVEGEEDPEDKF